MATYISQKAVIEKAKTYAKELNYDFIGIGSFWSESTGEREFFGVTKSDISRMKKAIKEAFSKNAKRISFIMYEGSRRITVDFPTTNFIYHVKKI